MQSFLYSVAEDLIHRFGSNLSHIAIVFNNKRPSLFLKKYLSELSRQPIWSPVFFTVQEFFAQSDHTTVADSIPRFFLLLEAYNEQLTKEGKEIIEPDAFLPLAETILKDFDQIDYDLVNLNLLFQYLKDTKEIELQFSNFTSEQQDFLRHFWAAFSNEKQIELQQKFLELWKRLPLVYALLNKKMKGKGLTSMAQLYRNLAEGISPNPDFINAYQKVIFIGFNALNKCEVKMFKQWQEADKALFYFDADAYYFDDTIQEAGLFLRKNIYDYKLKNALGDFPSKIREKEKQISIYPVLGNITQAKTLSKLLKSATFDATNSIKYAIVLADEHLLLPVLQTIPEHIKLNVTMGFPIRQSPILGFVDLWLSIQEQLTGNKQNTIRKEDIVALLSHPLSGLDTELAQNKIEDINSISGNQILISMINLPEKWNYLFQKPQDGLSCINTLDAQISEIIIRKGKEDNLFLIESSLLLSVHQMLNQLFDGLMVFHDKLSVNLAISFIRKALSGIVTPLEGEPLHGLQVMGMLESRCLDFEEIIILGANEGILPHLSITPTFIPDSLRRVYGLPVSENQDALSAYLFYRLIQHSKKVSIVYNSIIDNNSTGEISRFVQQLQFESNLKINIFPQNQPTQLNPNIIQPLVIAKTPEVIRILKNYLTPNSDWKLSASALKLYLQCPLQFFFKYIARIKEPPLPSVITDAQSIGTILHKVLETFYSEFKGKSVVAAQINNKLKIIPELCISEMSDYLFRDKEKLSLMGLDSAQKIALSIIEENVKIILQYDANIVAPFTIIELENREDYGYSFPIDVEGKSELVNLYAIIDRVDDVKGQRRIVDYKTGGDLLSFKNIEELFATEKTGNLSVFQALFYALVYQKVENNSTISPHLYIIRKLMDEGSAPGYNKAKTLIPYSNQEIEKMMTEFETALKKTLEELFNPEIPFEHNPYGTHYESNPYSLFCNIDSTSIN